MMFLPGRWLHKALACSVCGNLLFLFVLALGYYLDNEGELDKVAKDAELVAPDCIRRSERMLYFCEAPPDSELARLAPNVIYVASDGVHRARFEFVSGDMRHLKEIGVMDSHGRPWVNASLEDGSLIYNRYLDDIESNPEFSLIDKDRDGIPDRKVKWNPPESFEPQQRLTWRRADGD